MRLKLIVAGFVGWLLGGSCALATLLLVILADRLLLAPVEPPRPRETVALSSWATPAVAVIPPVIETPLPPADTPVSETPAALLPTVTPPIDSVAPVPTLGFEQGQDQISPMVATPVPAFGEIATRLVIPTIGLDTPVVLAPRRGDSWATEHLHPVGSKSRSVR